MAEHQTLPFNRRSVSWKVAAEPVVFLGGGRALLLQVAHPKVAAGVEHHSTYASDPWARLFRTVDVMTKLAFASPEVSAEQARLLDRMHSKVVGTTADGEPYDARDPELLRWVWATLADTALLVYERVFPRLSSAERDAYYEEWKLVAHACGVPEGGCPTTWGEFCADVEQVIRDDLRATPEARKVVHATMVPPLPSPLRAVAAPAHQLMTVGLLPPGLREEFGFSWDARRERQLRRTFAQVRMLMKVTPRLAREVPSRYTLRRQAPLQIPWLQRRGAELTQRRMAELEAD